MTEYVEMGAGLVGQVRDAMPCRIDPQQGDEIGLAPGGVLVGCLAEAFRKYCLVNGFDDIGLTLRHADKILAFEAERIARMPWLTHREL